MFLEPEFFFGHISVKMRLKRLIANLNSQTKMHLRREFESGIGPTCLGVFSKKVKNLISTKNKMIILPMLFLFWANLETWQSQLGPNHVYVILACRHDSMYHTDVILHFLYLILLLHLFDTWDIRQSLQETSKILFSLCYYNLRTKA